MYSCSIVLPAGLHQRMLLNSLESPDRNKIGFPWHLNTSKHILPYFSGVVLKLYTFCIRSAVFHEALTTGYNEVQTCLKFAFDRILPYHANPKLIPRVSLILASDTAWSHKHLQARLFSLTLWLWLNPSRKGKPRSRISRGVCTRLAGRGKKKLPIFITPITRVTFY